jgi:hypothetical protein
VTESVQTNNFTGMLMQDVNGYFGGVNFAPVALVDGIPTAINISGLYPHEYDTNARYVHLDVRPFR